MALPGTAKTKGSLHSGTRGIRDILPIEGNLRDSHLDVDILPCAIKDILPAVDIHLGFIWASCGLIFENTRARGGLQETLGPVCYVFSEFYPKNWQDAREESKFAANGGWVRLGTEELVDAHVKIELPKDSAIAYPPPTSTQSRGLCRWPSSPGTSSDMKEITALADSSEDSCCGRCLHLKVDTVQAGTAGTLVDKVLAGTLGGSDLAACKAPSIFDAAAVRLLENGFLFCFGGWGALRSPGRSQTRCRSPPH